MRAYFALLWHPEDPAANAEAGTLIAKAGAQAPPTAERLEAPGLFLLDLGNPAGPANILPIGTEGDHGAGAVFGTLFRPGDGSEAQSPVRALSPAQTGALLRSGGSRLVRDFWGHYAGFLRDRNSLSVIADPAGCLPCYYTCDRGVLCVFSNLELCPWLDLASFTVNARFIADLLVYDKILTGETGLTQVHELLGGQRLVYDGQRAVIDQVWDPRNTAAEVLEPEFEDAARLLRETTCRVVRSWAGLSRDIAVSLSGGLDSSMVLSALGNGAYGGSLAAVHFRLGSGDPPECHYARLSADMAACPLTEVAIDPGCGQEGLPARYPLSVRPFRQFTSPDLAALIPPSLQTASGLRFTGQGGDHLFRDARDAAMFADYIRRHGPGLQSGRRLLEAARLSDQSIWRVLAQTLPEFAGRRAPSPYLAAIRKRQTLLNQAASHPEDMAARLPDWVRDPGGLPPAKFAQVCALLHMTQLRQQLASTGLRETIHPLLSLPLVELCLRLPAWTLSAGGQNRGLARYAFREMIPPAVRQRMTKGSASRFYVDRITLFREQIVDTLISGKLVSLGLLTNADIESFGARETYMTQTSGVMMLFYYGIECWLRSWADVSAAG